jgi:hypothetical protein
MKAKPMRKHLSSSQSSYMPTGSVWLFVIASLIASCVAASPASLSSIAQNDAVMNHLGPQYVHPRQTGMMPYFGPQYACAEQLTTVPLLVPVGTAAINSSTCIPTTAVTSGPLANAQLIWQAESGFPEAVPNLQTVNLQSEYDNNTSSYVNVVISDASDDIASTSINGMLLNSTDCSVGQTTVSLPPGPSTITVTAENDDPTSTAPNPAGYAFAMTDAATGALLMTSNGTWQAQDGTTQEYENQCGDVAVAPTGTAGYGSGSTAPPSTSAPPTTASIQPNWSGSPAANCATAQSYINAAWMTSFPDPSAEDDAPACTAEPNGMIAEYGITYNNESGVPISATAALVADDLATLSINGQIVLSYSDGGLGGNGNQTYLSTGGVAEAQIELAPGINQIVVTNTNQCNTCSGPNPMGAFLDIFNSAILSTGTTPLVVSGPGWTLLGVAP